MIGQAEGAQKGPMRSSFDALFHTFAAEHVFSPAFSQNGLRYTTIKAILQTYRITRRLEKGLNASSVVL